jgi:hypothetical protein
MKPVVLFNKRESEISQHDMSIVPSATYKSLMLSVTMQNVVKLNVMAPKFELDKFSFLEFLMIAMKSESPLVNEREKERERERK